MEEKGAEYRMMNKIDVNGPGADHVYKFLKEEEGLSSIAWNFATYLVIIRVPKKGPKMGPKMGELEDCNGRHRWLSSIDHIDIHSTTRREKNKCPAEVNTSNIMLDPFLLNLFILLFMQLTTMLLLLATDHISSPSIFANVPKIVFQELFHCPWLLSSLFYECGGFFIKHMWC